MLQSRGLIPSIPRGLANPWDVRTGPYLTACNSLPDEERCLNGALTARAGAFSHIIAIALAAYGVFMTVSGYFVGKPAPVYYFTALFIPAGLFAARWFLKHPNPEERARWVYPFIFCVAVLASVRDVLEMVLTPGLEVANLSLLVLGAAVVLLDLRWYAGVLGLAVGSWAVSVALVDATAGVQALSLRLASSCVVGLVMHLALATVHRQREQAVAKTEVILNAIGAVGEGYLLTDGRHVLEVNDAYLHIARRTREEVLALDDIMTWTPPEDREALRTRLRDRLAGQGGPASYEARMIRGDGTIVDLEVSVMMLSTSQPRIFSIVRDISDRKAAEQELRASQALKDKLMAALSHDLRTPLASIFGFSEVLRASWDRVGSEERSQMLERVSLNARELEDMIDQLLDYSRLEHEWTAIAPSRIALRPWLDEWSMAKAPLLREHRLVVDVPERLTVHADERALARIVGNLVSNAAKFSPPSTTITIGARLIAGGVEVQVRDQGPGIDPTLRDHLFDPFTQGPAPGAAKGIGMGLAIVKRYVELHGGRVEIHSPPGGGTVFTLFLPAGADVLARTVTAWPE